MFIWKEVQVVLESSFINDIDLQGQICEISCFFALTAYNFFNSGINCLHIYIHV